MERAGERLIVDLDAPERGDRAATQRLHALDDPLAIDAVALEARISPVAYQRSSSSQRPTVNAGDLSAMPLLDTRSNLMMPVSPCSGPAV